MHIVFGERKSVRDLERASVVKPSIKFLVALKRAVLGCRAGGVEVTAGLRLGLGFGLLRQKNGLDVGQHASLGNGHSGQEFVQLLVVPDGQLEMAGNDTGLLVVTSGVAGQLEDFSSQVFHDGGQVDGSTSPDTLGVVALAEKTVNSSNGELQPGTR